MARNALTGEIVWRFTAADAASNSSGFTRLNPTSKTKNQPDRTLCVVAPSLPPKPFGGEANGPLTKQGAAREGWRGIHFLFRS
jgi:hypothetical protein